jgi:hypothetical protein
VPYIDFTERPLEEHEVLSGVSASGHTNRLLSKQLARKAIGVGTHLPRRQGIRVYEQGCRCQRLHTPLASNPSKPHGIFAQVRVMPQVFPFRLREVQVPSTPQDPLGEIPRGFAYLGGGSRLGSVGVILFWGTELPTTRWIAASDEISESIAR